jgi:oxaloacetate decarboxylase (Na+ extruding) subunit gamma
MENLVFEGFKFMVLGMGTVFAFLILMIIAMNLQAYIVRKFFPEPVPVPQDSKNKSKQSAKIAAISAAIMHHKQAK